MTEREYKVTFWKRREKSLEARKQRVEDKLETVRWRIEKYLKPVKRKKELSPCVIVMNHLRKIVIYTRVNKRC